MPNKLWFHKWSEFSALSPEDRQAFLVSEVVDQFMISKIENYKKTYGINVPQGADRAIFIRIIFYYCASLNGAREAWEEESIILGDVSSKPIQQKLVAYHMFKKYANLVHGFHYSPADGGKAKYITGLIPYVRKYSESHFDDLCRYMAETDFSGKILDEVLADAKEKLGRTIYEHDIENRFRSWGVV